MSKGRALALSLFLLALAVRVIRFGEIPGGFNQDEAMAAYEAYSLASYGTDRFGTSFPAYFSAWGFAQMNVLESYLMIPFIKLFGLNNITARLPMLLASMGGLYALYRFTRLLGERLAAARSDDKGTAARSRDKRADKKRGWLSAGDSPGEWLALTVLAFAAVNPWHIMQSRWALESNMFPHFLMIGFWLLYEGVYGIGENKRGGIKIYASMIFFGLSMYAYGIAYFTVPLMLLALSICLLIKRIISLKRILICAAVFIFVSLPIILVMVVNFFGLPTVRLGFITAEFFPYSSRMSDLLFFSENIPSQLFENIKALYETVFLQRDGLPWSMLTMYGDIYHWAMPFAFCGAAYCVYLLKKYRAEEEAGNTGKKYVRLGVVFLLCWTAVALLSGLVTNGVNTNRINIVWYPILIFTGIGLYKATQLVSVKVIESVEARLVGGRVSVFVRQKADKKAKRVRFLISAGITVLISFSFFGFTHEYFTVFPQNISGYFYSDFFTALSAASENAYEKIYITAWTQFEGSDYVTEILTLYGKQIAPADFMDGSFRDKYKIVKFEGVPSPESGAAYLFNSSEAYFFPPDLFDVTNFGLYGLAAAREDG